MLIKRGIILSFDLTTYTAEVLLFEATSYALPVVALANHLDGSSLTAGMLCAVLFFDEHNPQDAVVLATFANNGSGLPQPPPGRVTVVDSYRQLHNVVITSGSSATYTLTGSSAAIPQGASAVLYKAYFTSPSAGAYIQLAPHAASDLAAYITIGNLDSANGYLNESGLLPIDSAGKIDIKANAGMCTVTLYTYGYTY